MSRFFVRRLRQNTTLWGVVLGIPLLLLVRMSLILMEIATTPFHSLTAFNPYWALVGYFAPRSLFMGGILGCLTANLAMSQIDHDTQRLRGTTRVSFWVMLLLWGWLLLTLPNLIAMINTSWSARGFWGKLEWFAYFQAMHTSLVWAIALCITGSLRLRRWAHEGQREQSGRATSLT